jgi:hypothetical protein
MGHASNSARISPRRALPIQEAVRKVFERSSASTAGLARSGRAQNAGQQAEPVTGGVSSLPSRSTNRLVKLPSVTRPSSRRNSASPAPAACAARRPAS